MHGAEVFCTKGSDTTTMVSSCNSRTGCELVIIDTDTIPGVSFDGCFGICETREDRGDEYPHCEGYKELLPHWFEVKEDYCVDGCERPHVTMQSFAVWGQ